MATSYNQLPKTIRKVRIENRAFTQLEWSGKKMLPYEMGVVLKDDGNGIERIFINNNTEDRNANEICRSEDYCLYSNPGAHLPIAKVGLPKNNSGKLGGVIPHSNYFQVTEDGYLSSNLFIATTDGTIQTNGDKDFVVKGDLTAQNIIVNRVESIQSPTQVIKINVGETVTSGSQTAVAQSNYLTIYGTLQASDIISVTSSSGGIVTPTGVEHYAAGSYGFLTKIQGPYTEGETYTVKYSATISGANVLTGNSFAGLEFANIGAVSSDDSDVVKLGIDGNKLLYYQMGKNENRRKILHIDEYATNGLVKFESGTKGTYSFSPGSLCLQNMYDFNPQNTYDISLQWEAGSCLEISSPADRSTSGTITYSHSTKSVTSSKLESPANIVSSVSTDGYGHLSSYTYTPISEIKQSIQDSIEEQITTNTTDINTLKGKVGTLESTVSNHDTTIATHTTDISSINTNLSKCVKWQESVSKQGIIIGNGSTVKGSEYTISTSSDFSTIDNPSKVIPTVSQITAYIADQALEEVEVTITGMEDRIANLENDIADIEVINSVTGGELIEVDRDSSNNVTVSHSTVTTTSTNSSTTITKDSPNVTLLNDITCGKGHVTTKSFQSIDFSPLFNVVEGVKYTSGTSDILTVDNTTKKISHLTQEITEISTTTKTINKSGVTLHLPTSWDEYGHIIEMTEFVLKTDVASYSAGDGITITNNVIEAVPYTAADDNIEIDAINRTIGLSTTYTEALEERIKTLEKENVTLKAQINTVTTEANSYIYSAKHEIEGDIKSDVVSTSYKCKFPLLEGYKVSSFEVFPTAKTGTYTCTIENNIATIEWESGSKIEQVPSLTYTCDKIEYLLSKVEELLSKID